MKEFLDAFCGRLGGLAAAHATLMESRWRSASLQRIALGSLEPYPADPRLHLALPERELEPGLALALALIFHELATNAIKYGALSVPDGRVTLSAGQETEPHLLLVWREEGGPPTEPPSPKQQGFGTRMLQACIAQHGGAVELDWRRRGLICHLPARQLISRGSRLTGAGSMLRGACRCGYRGRSEECSRDESSRKTLETLVAMAVPAAAGWVRSNGMEDVMVLGAINHVAITVSDFDRAKALYRPLLEFMGYSLTLKTDALMVWESAAAGSAVNLWLAKPGLADRRHERYAPGLHHIAFNADSREQVDQLAAHLRDWHVDVLDPPAQYDEYVPGYYAVYFQDPDGIKLELAHIPQ